MSQVVVQLRDPIRQPADHDVRFKSSGGDAVERRKEGCGGKLEFSERTVDKLLHLLIAGSIGDHQALRKEIVEIDREEMGWTNISSSSM